MIFYNDHSAGSTRNVFVELIQYAILGFCGFDYKCNREMKNFINVKEILIIIIYFRDLKKASEGTHYEINATIIGVGASGFIKLERLLN